MAKKFSDNMLSQLYLGLAADYKNLSHSKPELAADQIYWALYSKVYTELSNAGSAFYGLEVDEQAKAWAVFNAFIASTPRYKNNVVELQQWRRKETINTNLNQKQTIYIIQSPPYCRHDALFDWAMLNIYFNSLHAHSHHGGVWGSHHHGHSNEGINGEGLAFLVMALIVLIAAVLACLALYYMLSQTLDSLERFVWNEGWLQAFISMSSMVAFSVAGAFLGTLVVASPLSALALAAGISNPVGLVIFTTVCLSLAVGALGCFATNALQKQLSKNAEAIDPADACRFQLTDSETNHLLENGFDPVAVKCAITALREKMGEKPVPSLLNRWFTTHGGETQKLLAQVRRLRRGELSEITVDDMVFNLRQPQMVMPAFYYNAEQQTYNYQSGYLYPQMNVYQPPQYHGQTNDADLPPPPAYPGMEATQPMLAVAQNA